MFHIWLLAEDILAEEKGECVICLEDLLKGHVIARLPCLCVYHKRYNNAHNT